MKRTKFIARLPLRTVLLSFIFSACFTLAAAQSVTVQYATTQDWGGGFQGQITINNGTTQAINGWTLAFDFDRNITSTWDAMTQSHSGTRYTIKNANHNAAIPAGGSVAFGFAGSPGNVTNPPTNFVLNGIAVNRTATTFAYQGRLNDSATTAGVYDMQFGLYDDAGTQIGTAQTIEDVQATNGIFNVLLDFGSAAFSGANRSLEIRVRRASETGAFTTLSPRQPITPAPYAINALQLEGKSASSFLQNSTAQQTNTNFNISGSGTIGSNLNVNGTLTSGCRSGFTAIASGRLCVSALKPVATFYGSAGATQTCIGLGARVGTIADATLSLTQNNFDYFGGVPQGWLGDYAGDNLRPTWNGNSNGGDFDGSPINVYTGGTNGTAPTYQYRCVY